MKKLNNMAEKKYNIAEDVAFFRRLAKFRREHDSTSPDAFNEVARALFGMTTKEAQMLYTQYRQIAQGAWAWDEDQEEKTIAILTKAQQVLEKSWSLLPDDSWKSITSYLGRETYSDKNRIGVWARYKDQKPQLHELFVNSPKNLAMIYEMERSKDIEILCIVPWVDYISDVRDCENDLNGNSSLQVYDGDIFVSYNKGKDSFWNKPEKNGVYVCIWGAYRRLLYTVGRGYMTGKGEPNVADDNDDDNYDVFTYGEGRFSHYVLSMDHKWKRIGNIHADVTLLEEKKKKSK